MRSKYTGLAMILVGILLLLGLAYLISHNTPAPDDSDLSEDQEVTESERVTGENENIPGGVERGSSTLSGTFGCLPHRDTDGPVTMECAFGIHADNGSYYALDTSAIAMERIMAISSGSRIRVTGVVVPIEALSSDQWLTYDIEGIMRVESLTQL